MKAAVVQGVGSIRVESRPRLAPGPGEVCVKVEAVGICGSDLHWFTGHSEGRRNPGLIIGHEAAGVVSDVGSGVLEWKAGDRVAINPQIHCGECFACVHGWPNLCDNMQVIGTTTRGLRHGAMCEYLVLPARQLHRLGEGVSFEEAAMLDPLGNAFHVFGRTCLSAGDTVLIVGTGTIGLVAVQAARISGAGTVICTDVVESRLAVASQLGATRVVNATLEDPVDVVMKLTDGIGADVVLEAVGKPDTYRQAAMALRKRGTLLALGFMGDEISLPSWPLIFRELNVHGSTGFVFETEPVLSLLAERRIRLDPLLTHSFPIDEVQQAFETAADPSSGAIKVMVRP